MIFRTEWNRTSLNNADWQELAPFYVPASNSSSLDTAIVVLKALLEMTELIHPNNEDRDDDYDCSSTEDEDDSSDQTKCAFVQDIHTYVSCLMDLLPTLERAMLVDEQAVLTTDEIPIPSKFHVSEPAAFYVSFVLAKFQNIDLRLAQRLGEANWQRHVRVRTQIAGSVEPTEAVESKEIIQAQSIFVPRSLFQDSGLVSSLPTQSSYAASAASHTSSISSLANDHKEAYRVPPTPAEVHDREHFRCFICGHMLCNIKNHVDWKWVLSFFSACCLTANQHRVHVFGDLQPYICTWSQCKDELVTFPTRKLWADHELDQHYVSRAWKCYRCSSVLSTPGDWRQHLADTHEIELPQKRIKAALEAAETLNSNKTEGRKCPMCRESLGQTRRAFASHVGRHMEEIALACLPGDVDGDSDVKSAEPLADDSIELLRPKSKATKNRARRLFYLCPFAQYDCASTFTSKAHWKRHVSTHHMRLGVWRCDICPRASADDSNEFDRKDLFLQHLCHMHAPPKTGMLPPNPDQRETLLDFSDIEARMKDRYHHIRLPPSRSCCLFCPRSFEGPNSWDERMEHIAKHMERDANTKRRTRSIESWREDSALREWLIRERLIKGSVRGDNEENQIGSGNDDNPSNVGTASARPQPAGNTAPNTTSAPTTESNTPSDIAIAQRFDFAWEIFDRPYEFLRTPMNTSIQETDSSFHSHEPIPFGIRTPMNAGFQEIDSSFQISEPIDPVGVRTPMNAGIQEIDSSFQISEPIDPVGVRTPMNAGIQWSGIFFQTEDHLDDLFADVDWELFYSTPTPRTEGN